MINPIELLNFSFESCDPKQEALPLHWRVPPNLPYFKGHFPNNPVLPAVAILDLSIEMIKGVAQTPNIALKKVTSAKFLDTIGPQRLVQIKIKNLSQNEWGITWLDGENPDKKLVKLHLNFTTP